MIDGFLAASPRRTSQITMANGSDHVTAAEKT